MVANPEKVDAATSSQSAIFIRGCAAKPGGVTRSDPNRVLHIEVGAKPLEGWEALARGTRKVKIMPLIQLLEVLIVVGVLLWLVNRFIPMQGTIKSILNGVVVIAVVLWLLNVFGLFNSLSRIHIGT
jgi:hypothetical protein